MQVVSNRLVDRSKVTHSRTMDDQRVDPVSRVERRRKERRDQQARSGYSKRFSGRAALSAQVIAGRDQVEIDIDFTSSNQLVGTTAYQSALERKVHKMEKGSFYVECA